MELKIMRCPSCGAEGSIDRRGEKWFCAHCGTSFTDNSAERAFQKMEKCLCERVDGVIDDALMRQRQENYYNLRSALWDKIHAPNIDSAEILRICRNIKELAPSDFLADFFEVANSAPIAEVAAYIGSINAEENELFADLIIEFVIRSLKFEYIAPLNYFIERSYRNKDLEKFEEYITALETEAEKVSAGIYETLMPRDVFLAYSSKDLDKVMEIMQLIEESGLSCFAAFRNLQHGRGAVANYSEALHEAIDNCKIIVFVSSKNSRSFSCDAFKEELAYIRKKELAEAPPQYRSNYAKLPLKYRKPRIEYRLDNVKTMAADMFMKEFFAGLDYCETQDKVLARLVEYIMEAENAPDEEEEAARIAEEERRAEEARRTEEFERRMREAEKKAAEGTAEVLKRLEEARLAEEARRAEDEKRRAEEAKRREEAKRAEEARRIADEKRRAEEAKRAEEARKAEEARRIENEKRRAEEAKKAASAAQPAPRSTYNPSATRTAPARSNTPVQQTAQRTQQTSTLRTPAPTAPRKIEKIRHESGFVYEGEVKDGLMHGKGRLTAPNGDVYDGFFADNKKNGRGTYRWTNGDVYIGDWLEDKKHGRGTLTFADGKVYSGPFANGHMHGVGRLKFPNGDVYEGSYVNSARSGRGKLTFADGRIYTGDFVKGVRTGKGRMAYKDGRIYSGAFVNGKQHGWGKYTYTNGDVYEGFFINDQKSGKGKFIYNTGDVYDGDFVKDVKHGKGKLIWKSGASYNGEWKNGKKHGQGRYTFPSGNVFAGPFYNDQMHGTGVMIYTNGKRENVTYSNGRLVTKK